MEYLYDITVRRQYSFANAADAINYAHGICDKVSNGASYAHVMGDVKNDVRPNDEYAANYLVSNAVNIYALPNYGSCATRRPTTCRHRDSYPPASPKSGAYEGGG